MAWSWSHTPEAYHAARVQLDRLKKGQLNAIYSEWKYAQRKKEIERLEQEASDRGEELDIPFDAIVQKELFRTSELEALKIPHDILADQIWDWMEEQSTCDNGGFNAWCCPYGCHTVPFDYPRNYNPDV